MTNDMSIADDNAPFNHWLKTGLRALFNEVVREPIPENLLRIITEAEPEVRSPASDLDAQTPPAAKRPVNAATG
ncbi:hypothetical protein S101446_00852 [Komagataeibacter europaeus]|nr:hypothetical protein S101446_00852 [Komagataeibacter europaeus]